MRTLVWTSRFTRGLRHLLRRQPALRPTTECVVRQLAQDPFHPSLHSHKLKGDLAGVWACTLDYDHRILFEFVSNPESAQEEIHLLATGTHDEVY